jgi:hypothetical protein
VNDDDAELEAAAADVFASIMKEVKGAFKFLYSKGKWERM